MKPTPERMVASARALTGATQTNLADRLTEITGEKWTQTMVASIENGRRRLRVDELEAFAEAQGVHYDWYLGKGMALVGGRSTVPASPRPTKVFAGGDSNVRRVDFRSGRTDAA